MNDVFCRRGFTLIELLIVIGIIGILSGILLTQFSGASESAMSAKCMTNMRNLAVAAYTAAGANRDGNFPAAGSYEYFSGSGRTRHERVGWISWVHDKGVYGSKTTTHKSSPSWTQYLTYPDGNKNERDRHRQALTNGVLWAYCGRNSETYVCPKHVKACREDKSKLVPAWSYVMNSLFGYDETKGSGTMIWSGQTLSAITSRAGGGVKLAADRVLLFAEVPFTKIERSAGSVQNSVELEGSTAEFDCTLQYDDQKWSGTKECIGFNHKSARRYVAHVAFADGHVASLMLPKDMSETEVRDLTTWLCQGDEIYFSGKAYERVSKADKKEK